MQLLQLQTEMVYLATTLTTSFYGVRVKCGIYMRNGNMLRVRAGVRVRVMTRASVGIVVRFHFAVVLFNFFTVWLGAISPNLQLEHLMT